MAFGKEPTIKLELPKLSNDEIFTINNLILSFADDKNSLEQASILTRLPDSIVQYMKSKYNAEQEADLFYEILQLFNSIFNTGTSMGLVKMIIDQVKTKAETPNTKLHDPNTSDDLADQTAASAAEAMEPLEWLDRDNLNQSEIEKLLEIFEVWKNDLQTSEIQTCPQRVVTYIKGNSRGLGEMERQLRVTMKRLINPWEDQDAARFASAIIDWIQATPKEAGTSVRMADHMPAGTPLSTEYDPDQDPANIAEAPTLELSRRNIQLTASVVEAYLRDGQVHSLDQIIAAMPDSLIDFIKTIKPEHRQDDEAIIISQLDFYFDKERKVKVMRTIFNHILGFEPLPEEPQDIEDIYYLAHLGSPAQNRISLVYERTTDLEDEAQLDFFAQNMPRQLIQFIQYKIENPQRGWPLLENIAGIFQKEGSQIRESKILAEKVIAHAQETMPAEQQTSNKTTTEGPVRVSNAEIMKPADPQAEKRAMQAKVHGEFKQLCKDLGVDYHPMFDAKNFTSGATIKRTTRSKPYKIDQIDYSVQKIRVYAAGSKRGKGETLPFKDFIEKYLVLSHIDWHDRYQDPARSNARY